MTSVRILQGDCREVMATLPEASVDAIVTDPPYELGFMGKGWDRTGVANDVETWRQALRVLKPGGHLLAFGGTRTYHRLAAAIEDAGFEIRDQIGWLYGSGFPKSLDVSKAIDKAAGAERKAVLVPSKPGNTATRGRGPIDMQSGFTDISDPVTDAARQWQGWGTALKPAWEPIVLARKPLVGTVAANVQEHGTGALNIDSCRVGLPDGEKPFSYPNGAGGNTFTVGSGVDGTRTDAVEGNPLGRWPANVIHDGSDEVVAAFPAEAGGSGRQGLARGVRPSGFGNVGADKGSSTPNGPMYADTGSAARFFYCAKADAGDRSEGLQTVTRSGRNVHPTVKPTELMRYLCRLVTPPGGTVLDPFMGSGSTLKAAELEGFSAIGIELDQAYIEIARRRIASDAPLFREVA